MARATHHHDCLSCMYLGTIVSKWETGRVADLYYCGDSPESTSLVARYGDEGPDYTVRLHR
jgi:hypothetical protein